MNEDQLKQIQNIELEILDEIMRICNKHKIPFIMMGGTCLGAIRHQGIIPWDDDIDLGMLRSDYDRFAFLCKTELSDNYFFQDFDTEKYCGFIFGKIRKNDTALVEEYSKNVKMNQGIWVDIFPFDYVSDDIAVHQKKYSKLLFFRNLLAIKQGFKVKKTDTRITKILYFLVKSFIWLIPRKVIINKLNQLMINQNEVPTNTLFPYGCAWGLKERISTNLFFETINVEFNGRSVPVFKDYDTYLRNLYGDYMTPPPLEKRNSGHDVCHIKF